MDFPGRQAHDYTRSTGLADVMNDRIYDINRRGKERELEEPDTCRICRGEATEQEPLYYPCKCSGSIKFVHQPCLVQWLSHSQKKHCELCKTPFHFTKVYDPDMPKNLPALLFAKQILIHSCRTTITWLRWVLVAFVWLGWLPWSMRAIWRALFWLADGRWSSGDLPKDSLISLVKNHTSSLDSTIATSGPPALTNSTDAPSFQSPTPSIFGFPSGEPLLLTLIKKAFSALFFPAMSSGFSSPSPSNVTATAYKPRRPSWLSDVKFLTSLTPSPTINNILIDTLEGQLITLLVVVSFILIFLIREWVVQQRPLDNIAEGEREAAVQLIANNRPGQDAEPPQPQPEQAAPRPREGDLQHGGINENVDETVLPANGSFHDPNTALAPSNADPLNQDDGPNLREITPPGSRNSSPHRNGDGDNGLNLAFAGWQPPSQANQPWPAMEMEVFRDLRIRANGDLEEMLRIVREEGRQEELGWLVTKLLQNDNMQHSGNSEHNIAGPSNSTSHEDSGVMGVDSTQAIFPEFSGSSSRGQSLHNPFETGNPSWGPSGSHPTGDWDNQFRQEPGFNFHDTDSDGSGLATPHIVPGLGAEEDNIHENSTASNVSNSTTTDAESSGSTPIPLEIDQTATEPPKTLARKAFDWFWADIIPDDQGQGGAQDAQERLVDEPILEPAPPHAEDNDVVNDGVRENQAALAEFGVDANDLDAIEEADDLEGILELIGMQGPIFGLLQNGVFCALLISFTVAAGIWLPYLGGKIALVLLVNPIQFIFGVPMTALSIVADVILDTLIGSLGYIMYWGSVICKVLLSPFGAVIPMGEWIKTVTNASRSLIDASGSRLGSVVNTFFVFHEADVPMFSVLSHQALKIHEARIGRLFRIIFVATKFVLHDLPLRIGALGLPRTPPSHSSIPGISEFFIDMRNHIYDFGNNLYRQSFVNSTNWVHLNLTGTGPSNMTLDYELAVWDTKDRTVAIIMGYLLASVVGLVYLRINRFISGADHGQRVEGMIAEGLHQAGGVMKVILIIGIEMIVFPLYCGSLLDIALLPLFEHATIASRIEFTSSFPLTSLFVHWFVGTCYMFHFALFVSMCRKIMRSGVLYFIRDPDDPTFHPVRDVLERNITTQLRKIAFSALVYGALVIVCLGGVVWGLYYGFNGILPVHWSSKNPVLEFPVDLLFYNFGIPLAVQLFKPSEGLHSLYNWWFRKCARILRLTDFFFGERQSDEEGHHSVNNWWGFLLRNKKQPQNPSAKEPRQPGTDGQHNNDPHFKQDGKFVRAPASDQVRIPKGSQVFLEVTETNERVDGAQDNDQGLHGRQNEMFTMVYIPPFFRTRIAAFLLLIWLFAAATGVGTTIIPLAIGRKVLSSSFPSRPVNDIYAFSAGVGIACAAACVALSCHACIKLLKDRLQPYLRSPREACLALAGVLASGLRLLYIFTSFSIFLPSVFALVMELYVLVPIHTYLGDEQTHVIHFIQDWTLGVLYVQMAVKLALWHSRSRPAAILNGIFRDGWLKPNAKLATRALLLPLTILAVFAVTLPLSFGLLFNSTMFYSRPDLQYKIYRYTYPITLLMAFVAWLAYLVCCQVEIWKVSIRDEFYLIGERLHNFREKRAREVGVPRRMITG